MREPSGISVLQRWVERADGRMELLELPLTPELFLDPQLGDKILQGSRHFRAIFSLYELISRHLSSEPGRFVSQAIGLAFGVSPDGGRIFVFDLKTGERLLADAEQEDALKAQREELARLRAEIERLKS